MSPTVRALVRLAAAVSAMLVLLSGPLLSGPLLAGPLLGGPLLAASSAGPESITFDAPTATGRLGEPITFQTAFSAPAMPDRVELVILIGDSEPLDVRSASVDVVSGDRYRATGTMGGHVSPNTTFDFRFRAIVGEAEVDGPSSSWTLVDDRFDWRTVSGDTVTVHWYEGDESFARRALDIGERAIDRAADLLGVAEVAPVDFLIYGATEPFRDALGPGTRENVGGQANAAIRTMFGLIEPSEIGSDWVDNLVAHELTHLVFADAVDNPYHQPPRWLNEGLAEYLAEGYQEPDRARIRAAVASGTLIPLDGLGGLFPAGPSGFSLAYSESVAAVDYFITTHGEDTLASLITGYARGITDEEAFRAATGSGYRAFDDAWIAAQGADRRDPLGPVEAPAGPVPPDWQEPPPSIDR
jgi:hypothetical protein